MKLSLFIASFFIAQAAFAQIKITQLNKTDIPKSIIYKGHIINAAKYTDKTGDHIVITTETGEVDIKNPASDGGRKADLFAFCYDVSSNSQYKLSWQLHDFLTECPLDITTNYVPGTFAVTDLDNNGIAEVWVMYRIACRGDVSPAETKIIMHERDRKYAVRGQSRVHLFDKNFAGGEYTLDAAFKNGSPAFRKYAIDLWKKNLMDNH